MPTMKWPSPVQDKAMKAILAHYAKHGTPPLIEDLEKALKLTSPRIVHITGKLRKNKRLEKCKQIVPVGLRAELKKAVTNYQTKEQP